MNEARHKPLSVVSIWCDALRPAKPICSSPLGPPLQLSLRDVPTPVEYLHDCIACVAQPRLRRGTIVSRAQPERIVSATVLGLDVQLDGNQAEQREAREQRTEQTEGVGCLQREHQRAAVVARLA